MPWVFPGPWMPHKMKTFPLQLSNSKLAISSSLEFERLEIVRIIIQNGAEINTKNLAGRSPLHFAVQTKELEVVKLLVQSGADINVKDLKNQSPLDIAHKNGYITIVNYLMEVAQDGLFDAICEADLERVKLCLENGAQINLNLKLKNRRTPSLPRVFFKTRLKMPFQS